MNVVASIVTSNQYHFVSRWRVEGTCGEVADILGDPLAFPIWWPSVYSDVLLSSFGRNQQAGAGLAASLVRAWR